MTGCGGVGVSQASKRSSSIGREPASETEGGRLVTCLAGNCFSFWYGREEDTKPHPVSPQGTRSTVQKSKGTIFTLYSPTGYRLVPGHTFADYSEMVVLSRGETAMNQCTTRDRKC